MWRFFGCAPKVHGQSITAGTTRKSIKQQQRRREGGGGQGRVIGVHKGGGKGTTQVSTTRARLKKGRKNMGSPKKIAREFFSAVWKRLAAERGELSGNTGR